VFLGGSKVAEGRVDNVSTGSSGFTNAVLSSIALGALPAGAQATSGTPLKIELLVRRTCVGGGHASGTVRLWYNGTPVDSGARRDAGSRLDVSSAGATTHYFLRQGGLLGTDAGSSKLFTDVAVDSKVACSAPGGRPFKSFGSWTGTLR
jgi:hypothetical protein